MAGDTTIHDLPYATDTDFLRDFPAKMEQLADTLDPLIATWGTGAALPAAGKPGRVFQLSSGEVHLDVGSGWIELATQPTIPIGGQVPYGGTSDPPGGRWLLADGRLVSQATYPLLHPAIGHRYNLGVDPGGGMVRLPDKRGRVSVGADSMGTAQGAAGVLGTYPKTVGERAGSGEHTLTLNQAPNHVHGATLDVRGAAETGQLGGSIAVATTFAPTTVEGVAVTGVTGHTGVTSPHPNLQPYEVDSVIVRVA